jgi:sugar/nucleoside kinase (ribokinase family)
MGPSSLGLCFGDLDRLPEPGEELFCHELAIRPRQAALTAITIQRLGGIQSRLHSPLARDFPGRYLEQLLEAEGVQWEGPVAEASGMRVDFGLSCETAVQVTDTATTTTRPPKPATVAALPLSWLGAAPQGARLCVLADGTELPTTPQRALAVLVATPATATAAAGTADLKAAIERLARVTETLVLDHGGEGAESIQAGARERVGAAPRTRYSRDVAHQLFWGAYLWAFARGLTPSDRLRWAIVHASRGDVP